MNVHSARTLAAGIIIGSLPALPSCNQSNDIDINPKRPTAAVPDINADVKAIQDVIGIIKSKATMADPIHNRIFDELFKQVWNVALGQGELSDIVGPDADCAIQLASEGSRKLWKEALQYARDVNSQKKWPTELESVEKVKVHHTDYEQIRKLDDVMTTLQRNPEMGNLALENQATQARFFASAEDVHLAAILFCDHLTKPGIVRPSVD